MSSRWKKIWADFWGNKSRSFLTILTVMVGTFAVGANADLRSYMLESMDGDYLSSQPSEATISASYFDEDMVEVARRVPGVDAAEGQTVIAAELIPPKGEPIQIIFNGTDDPSKKTLNLLQPAPGEPSLPVLKDKQMLLDATVAALGYQPGDTIVIELDNGKRRQLTLAGYMHDVSFPSYTLVNIINSYVTLDTLEWLGGSRQFNTLAVSVSENQTDAGHVTAVAQDVADRLERAGLEIYFVNVYMPGHHFAWSTTQGIFFILGALGYLTVFLSGFLIINTITAIMAQQTRQIGIMKAVGGGTGEIFAMYIVLILGFGFCALIIAIPLAGSFAQFFGRGMAEYLNFTALPFTVYRTAVIQQIFVALIVPLIAALWPIYNSVRITVREAISDYGIGAMSKFKSAAVNRRTVIIPRPLRLSLRNVFRRKLRLGLTLVSLVLGGAIFIGVYNLWASFDKTIASIQGYYLADINLSFGRYYRIEEVASIAESVPGVSSVEGWTEFPGTLISDKESAGTQIMFVAPPSDSTLIDPVIVAGRWLTPGDENAVVIGNHLRNMFPELKIGDWLKIKVGDEETSWQIVGFYIIPGNVNPPLLYVNYEYLSRAIGAPGQVYSLRILTTGHDAATQERVDEQLQAAFETQGIQVTNSQLASEFIESQTATTDILVYFMLVMATFIAIVGGLGLTGTMSINVLERTREIGVMRAIGASNMDIQTIVIVEGLVIGLISWAISILLSFPITQALTVGVGMAVVSTPLPVVYGTTGIFVWLITTALLSSFASALPARRASTLTVRDTLVYE